MHTPVTSSALPDELCVERRGNVLIVRLARPAKRNALNDATVEAIDRVFSSVPDDVHAIVLHGEGAHFSAGLDLAELTERDAVQGLMHSRMWHQALDRVQFGKAPVIAALHGAVIGGGLELACAAHIRVAEPSAYYALPEGQRGIFVGGGASVRLPRLIGVPLMLDMMMTGRVIKAEEGKPLGFSQYLVEEGRALQTALELAAKVAGNARMTNYALMHVLPRIADIGQEQGLMMEALTAAIAQSAPEAKARIRDFLEKRGGKVEVK
ncbi:MAG: enoyl-CoA hydratase [Gammaproteobacteria bacterium RIFCSPLOWO2_02_FULL_61_13]|nr:MAG: enoyl-CoA hydratase [Gammaproteobacteria bacterium RIFCSPLOWO2_02_FULL_61_13]